MSAIQPDFRERGIKLRNKDTIQVTNNEYVLEERIPGGFQFRTWLVRRKKDGKHFVAKATPELSRMAGEIRAYMFFASVVSDFPRRYHPKIEAFDHESNVIRRGKKIGELNVILLKYYPHYSYISLEKLLKDKNCTSEVRKRIAGKLKRRIEKLHDLSLAHGDLHKGNIMVHKTENRRIGVLLIDFGSSRFRDRHALSKDERQLQNILRELA